MLLSWNLSPWWLRDVLPRTTSRRASKILQSHHVSFSWTDIFFDLVQEQLSSLRSARGVRRGSLYQQRQQIPGHPGEQLGFGFI